MGNGLLRFPILVIAIGLAAWGREDEAPAKRQGLRRPLLIGAALTATIAGAVGVWIAMMPSTAIQPLAPISPPVKTEPPAGPQTQAGAAPLTPERERALKPNDTFKECANCPEMVVVPAGYFTMGSPASEAGRYDDEGPQHKVTLAKPLAVGRFSITRGEFATFASETQYKAEGGCYVRSGSKFELQNDHSWRSPGFEQDERHPVVCVNWNDAKAFVAWLSQKIGRQYRLLTEAEFEYGARAGTTTRYFFGDDEKDFCRYGNGADETAKKSNPGWQVLPCSDGYAYTAPADSFLPNKFGLYDMAGNAWQWVEDCYHDNYNGAPTDGSAWTSGDCSRRVVRGGSWLFNPQVLRSAARRRSTPDVRYLDLGFRVTRTLTT